VLSEANFVTLHLPLNEKSEALVGKDEIALMKPSAYIINTSRAQVIDECALYEALEEERIAGAALDVYAKASPPKDLPFFKLDNVITTPWIACNTGENTGNMNLICVENVLRGLEDKSLCMQ